MNQRLRSGSIRSVTSGTPFGQPDPQRQVRYVVFHRHHHEEFPKGSREIVDVTEWIQWYGRACGAPVYQDVDIVVSSTGAPHFILKREDVEEVIRIRTGETGESAI